MLGLTHNSGAITKPGGLFCQFQMSCHLQHFNSAEGISLAGSVSVLALVLFWFWFWFWFGFCFGPFSGCYVRAACRNVYEAIRPEEAQENNEVGEREMTAREILKTLRHVSFPFLSLSLLLSFIHSNTFCCLAPAHRDNKKD